MKKLLLLALTAAAFAAPSVHADELTATKRAQIKTLLELTSIKALPEQMANSTVQTWVPGVKQLDPKFPDKGFTIARDAMRDTLLAKADVAGGLIEQVTLVYHNAFTAAEINDLVKFYQSATGKKMLSSQGKVNGETFQAAMKWADTMAVEVDQRIDAALKKEGLKLPEAPKSAPTPAAGGAQPPAKK